MISFYKARKDCSGMACSFQYQTKEENKGKVGMFYLSMLRQTNWNEQTKTGSFVESKDDPQDSCVIKFNFSEAAGIISAIRRLKEWTYYHTSPNGVVQGNFRPYLQDNVLKGFSLTANKTLGKQQIAFSIGLQLNEAELLLIYLQGFITQFYLKRDEEYQTRQAQASQQRREAAPQTRPAPRQEQRQAPRQEPPAAPPSDVNSLDFNEGETSNDNHADPVGGGEPETASEVGW